NLKNTPARQMSHYIRTIRTDFTSRTQASSSSVPSQWYAGTSASAHANLVANLGGLINRYPPGLGHTEWRGPSGSAGPNPSPYSRRRTAVSARPPPATARRTPPPPPRTSYMKFDPFSDENASEPLPLPTPRRRLNTDPILYRTPRSTPASLSHSHPYSTHSHRAAEPYTIYIPPAAVQVAPPAPPPLDRNARSRLVAGILLNRVHAVGKPMRRRCTDGPREYVKSGLSRVVCVEA
ncbi:hypothetical protein H0H81_002665, partial [Sphagnurus paluster]